MSELTQASDLDALGPAESIRFSQSQSLLLKPAATRDETASKLKYVQQPGLCFTGALTEGARPDSIYPDRWDKVD